MIKNLKITDLPDGSGLLEIEMSPEMVKAYAAYGLLCAIEDAANRTIAEAEEGAAMLKKTTKKTAKRTKK